MLYLLMTEKGNLPNGRRNECISLISSVHNSVKFKHKYYVYDHTPLHTCEEYSKFGPNIPEHLNCCMPTKNLFLVDRKKQFFLITASADPNFDLKVISKLIGATGRAKFGSEEELKTILSLGIKYCNKITNT